MEGGGVTRGAVGVAGRAEGRRERVEGVVRVEMDGKECVSDGRGV